MVTMASFVPFRFQIVMPYYNEKDTGKYIIHLKTFLIICYV